MFDRFQNHLRDLEEADTFSNLQRLSQGSNVTSLLQFCRYFNGKYSDEIHSLVPQIEKFTTRAHHITITWSNQPYFAPYSKYKENFSFILIIPKNF